MLLLFTKHVHVYCIIYSWRPLLSTGVGSQTRVIFLFANNVGIANMSNIFVANNEHANTVVKCLYMSLNDSEFVLKLNYDL